MWKARCIYTHEIPCQDPCVNLVNRMNRLTHEGSNRGQSYELFEPSRDRFNGFNRMNQMTLFSCQALDPCSVIFPYPR